MLSFADILKERNDRIFRNVVASFQEVLNSVNARRGKWAMLKNQLENLNLDSIHNCEGVLVCGPFKERKQGRRSPPLMGLFLFNVDMAARGKLGLASIGGVLRNHEGHQILLAFCKYAGL
eukprot:TRINITY_DN59513_c0_g1_i1.p1 TRINITY_DN59513_c0_g1~~TRINITY_DN59513_c0_g1_i1.p1  ORF type:complete len:120 (-),score=15.26 TRINITY_DN59513_c0_g1_i1:655-1014(-)